MASELTLDETTAAQFTAYSVRIRKDADWASI